MDLASVASHVLGSMVAGGHLFLAMFLDRENVRCFLSCLHILVNLYEHKCGMSRDITQAPNDLILWC